MIELTIKKNDDQRRLDKFLCKTFNKVPKSKIFRLLRQREIKVNDKAIKNGDFKVTIGDKVKVFGLDMKMQNKERDIIPEIEVTFRVVKEDKNVLIVNKPANLVVHGPIDDTLDNQVKRYLYDRKEYDPKKENAFKVSHCNRIDKWSQGIVVYGKNLVTLRTLNEAFQDRDAIDKWYLTHVTKPVQQGMVKGFIYHDEPQKLMVFTFTKPKHNQAKEAITEVVSCKKITENKFLLNIKIFISFIFIFII